MAKGCIYTYNGKEYPETDFKNLLLSGELDGLLPKEVVDELPVVEKTAAKKTVPAESEKSVPSEPKAKGKLAKFKEKHLSQSKVESKGKTIQQPEPITIGEERIPVSETPSTGLSRGDVVTDKGKMEGVVTDRVEVGDEEMLLPEKGYLISGVSLNEGEQKGKGSGQEIYKKALDEHGVLYSSFPISEDAMRVQNKLVEKGVAKIETITLSDGTELRKITKSLSTKPDIKNETAPTEEERRQRIQFLTEEKQQKINEVTKPQITFDTGLSLTDLASTDEASRQLHDDYKSQLASLKNIVNCLWQ